MQSSERIKQAGNPLAQRGISIRRIDSRALLLLISSFIICIAVFSFAISDIRLLFAGLVCAAAGTALWLLQRPEAETLLLVGDDADLAVLRSILRGRGQEVVFLHAGSLEEAGRLLIGGRCREAILSRHICVAEQQLFNDRGKPLTQIPAAAKLELLLGRVQLDTFTNCTRDSQQPAHPRYEIVKRGLDCTLGVLCTLLFVLPFSAIWIALRLSGVRQPLVAETRFGKGGRPFTLYRFIDRPELAEQRQAHEATEPRLSNHLAHVIRRCHFDLLPAAINLVRGDVSLVGPRPESPVQTIRNTELLPAYRERLVCRPGLVSLAQVRFRYNDSLRDTRLALEYDLFYVKHEDWWLDLQIVGQAAILLAHDWWGTAKLTTSAAGHNIQNRSGSLRPRRLHPGNLASVAMPRDAGLINEDLKPTLIAGAGAGGELLAQELQRNASWGLWPVAFVDDDLTKIGARIHGIPVLGDTLSIPNVVLREHVDTVVIAMPSASETTIQRIASISRQTDAQLRTMPSIGAVLQGESAFALSPVPVTDVLGRPAITLEDETGKTFLAGKRVLVTGAAGSIGSEVTRQVIKSGPSVVYGLDVNESDLFDLQQELQGISGHARFEPIVGSVTNRSKMEQLLLDTRVDVIFHAAAYKHVPLMETYPTEAVLVNTLGTYQLAKSAYAAGVERFVLVSTDKAVRPSSIMGASKRLAELALRVVSEETGLSACAVRFGNVLGSRGSVIPLFEKQIAHGGPVTITDRRMKRYFMTIPEAAALIIQAGAFGDRNVIYMLDMGEEIAIKDLANRLIALHGFRPGVDIEIKEIGMRPGEKLSEELSLDFEQADLTSHSKIRILRDPSEFARVSALLPARLRELREIVLGPTPNLVSERVFELVAEFDGAAGVTESVRQKLAIKPEPIRARLKVVNAMTGSD